jgi:predicted RNA-binding protein with PIN domain
MTLIIDGHNLIPRIPGLSLSDPEDEDKLIHLLQDYARIRRKSVEVYFDKAPVGQAGERRFGQVRAHFVRDTITADEAIMARLQQLGKRAKNYTVVSSDHQVRRAAQALHATVITSEDFSAAWQALQDSTPELDPRNRLLAEDEVSEWEQLFKRGHRPEK